MRLWNCSYLTRDSDSVDSGRLDEQLQYYTRASLKMPHTTNWEVTCALLFGEHLVATDCLHALVSS